MTPMQVLESDHMAWRYGALDDYINAVEAGNEPAVAGYTGAVAELLKKPELQDDIAAAAEEAAAAAATLQAEQGRQRAEAAATALQAEQGRQRAEAAAAARQAEQDRQRAEAANEYAAAQIPSEIFDVPPLDDGFSPVKEGYSEGSDEPCPFWTFPGAEHQLEDGGGGANGCF